VAVDSLIAAARVHWALLIRPPAGTEDHVDDVDQSLRWLISWIPRYFPEQGSPRNFHHQTEAANSLACLGIRLLKHDRIEAAQSCASAIAGLASNSVAVRPEPYALADLHERLEILARAADALGKAQAAVSIRGMIQRPATISDGDWPHFLEARQTRMEQLDESLQERPRMYALDDNPIAELQKILSRTAARASLP
jgi:hypothetical protein